MRGRVAQCLAQRRDHLRAGRPTSAATPVMRRPAFALPGRRGTRAGPDVASRDMATVRANGGGGRERGPRLEALARGRSPRLARASKPASVPRRSALIQLPERAPGQAGQGEVVFRARGWKSARTRRRVLASPEAPPVRRFSAGSLRRGRCAATARSDRSRVPWPGLPPGARAPVEGPRPRLLAPPALAATGSLGLEHRSRNQAPAPAAREW